MKRFSSFLKFTSDSLPLRCSPCPGRGLSPPPPAGLRPGSHPSDQRRCPRLYGKPQPASRARSRRRCEGGRRAIAASTRGMGVGGGRPRCHARSKNGCGNGAALPPVLQRRRPARSGLRAEVRRRAVRAYGARPIRIIRYQG